MTESLDNPEILEQEELHNLLKRCESLKEPKERYLSNEPVYNAYPPKVVLTPEGDTCKLYIEYRTFAGVNRRNAYHIKDGIIIEANESGKVLSIKGSGTEIFHEKKVDVPELIRILTLFFEPVRKGSCEFCGAEIEGESMLYGRKICFKADCIKKARES
jgi:hypothetical protein